ncbi:isoprenylcysteine carboxylmethyltransferase family protein [Aurantimonas sp. A2-1-M11]|uniref:methyltransferase family protein n=1 Tax=Aurantimonas sp. A2-1-M11 TaxID=3113712 RepID=UPI002F92AB4C
MSISHNFPDIPPVWALGFLAAEVAAAFVLPLAFFSSSLTTMIGMGLIVVGLAVMVWSALWFRRKQTSIEPREVPTALIVEGPYRINRNPIYTGMALGLVGVAFWLGALSAVAVAIGFPFVITTRFIRGEEAALRSAFGPQADAYFARSRRW